MVLVRAIGDQRSWPAQIRTVYGDHQRMIDTYFHPIRATTSPVTARCGMRMATLRITGRVDDVLNVSGHRMGTAEVESAWCSMRDIAEAAVVGFPTTSKVRAFTAYVTPMTGVEDSRVLR